MKNSRTFSTEFEQGKITGILEVTPPDEEGLITGGLIDDVVQKATERINSHLIPKLSQIIGLLRQENELPDTWTSFKREIVITLLGAEFTLALGVELNVQIDEELVMATTMSIVTPGVVQAIAEFVSNASFNNADKRIGLTKLLHRSAIVAMVSHGGMLVRDLDDPLTETGS